MSAKPRLRLPIRSQLTMAAGVVMDESPSPLSPASMTATVVPESSDKREATTRPAVPPPTMTGTCVQRVKGPHDREQGEPRTIVERLSVEALPTAGDARKRSAGTRMGVATFKARGVTAKHGGRRRQGCSQSKQLPAKTGGCQHSSQGVCVKRGWLLSLRRSGKRRGDGGRGWAGGQREVVMVALERIGQASRGGAGRYQAR